MSVRRAPEIARGIWEQRVRATLADFGGSSLACQHYDERYKAIKRRDETSGRIAQRGDDDDARAREAESQTHSTFPLSPPGLGLKRLRPGSARNPCAGQAGVRKPGEVGGRR
jgi:hypothetical protein